MNQLINKTGVLLQNACEACWFEWGGDLYYIYSDRDMVGSDGKTMKIIKWDDGSLIATFGTDYGCQDCIVDSGTLYVFATHAKFDFSHKANSIYMFTSTNLTTWSGATSIKTMDANTQAYNIGVTKNTSTGYTIIAYEQQTTGNVWSTKFIKSNNYSTWTDTGGGCDGTPPDIHYISGTYYMLVGSTDHSLSTWVCKSTDLSTWTWSRLALLRPTFEFEDINTTDAAAVEFDGMVYILYMTGDQNTYIRLTYATYDGTLADMFSVYQQ